MKWVNLPGVTYMDGVEFQGGYDMGRAYANLSFTLPNTKQPLGTFAGIGADVGTLPDDFAKIDIGTRFFNENVTLGGRLDYTGKSIQAFGDQESSFKRSAFTLFDVYGSWMISESFRTFLKVNNIFNKSYWNPNAGTGDILAHVFNGRGRTIVIGATAKF